MDSPLTVQGGFSIYDLNDSTQNNGGKLIKKKKKNCDIFPHFFFSKHFSPIKT